MDLNIKMLSLVCVLSSVLSAALPSVAVAKPTKQAVEPSALSAKERDAVTSFVQKELKVQVLGVEPSPLNGFYQVTTNQGVMYLAHDKKHMFYGNLYHLEAGVQNLTELAQRDYRLEKIAKLEKNMIVFPAKQEKHVVTVFTDVSCGYCKKLHNEIKDYNDAGITVRYLAFPRAGVQGQVYETMQQVWCSEKPQNALTLAKKGEKIPQTKFAKRCDLEVKAQYDTGVALGVTGTPSMVLSSGEILPGYVPAANLSKKLSTKM